MSLSSTQRSAALAAALLLLSACGSPRGGSGRTAASESARGAQRPTPEEAERRLADQLALLESLSAPSEHHARLRPLAGDWEIALEAFGADGASLGVQAVGRASLEWMLGGRFLAWRSTLAIGARESRTFGLLGYAKEAQEYQLLMLSDLVDSMTISHGRGDLEREGISLRTSPLEAPRVGARRGVLRAEGPGRFVLEEHELGSDGRERLVQRATYKRVRTPDA